MLDECHRTHGTTLDMAIYLATWYESSLPWKPHVLLGIGFEVCKHLIATELQCKIRHKISYVTFLLILLAIENHHQHHARVCAGHDICSLILKQMTCQLNVRTVHCLIERNWPTLCTYYYHSFIRYVGSYMFRHPCAIFRELLMSCTR
jgi:hypothetical protein